MARRRNHPDKGQLDLLDWAPSAPVKAFPQHTVRAASLAASVSKAVSQALRGCGRSREDVAARMTAYLDEPVSLPMLHAYSSEAKSEHIINVVRFVVLIEATSSRELLQFIASQFGWAVVEDKYLPAIAMAERMERRAALDREIDADRRALKSNGVL
ncbi:hypothetical protein [Castellaniella sp.]|uniref:hypothetical protein n=1 Tax=Castellaniella sp. TaxID=1955812 RepID=UPI002AFEA787|nr:hypothetical protein [Castellaniella sp.]